MADSRIVTMLGGRSMVIALIVACAFFMENLDANIIVTALPRMGASFGIGPSRMSLGVTAYLLAVAACIPASGWLADRIGARNLFAGAIAVFTLSSMLCGAAPSYAAFIGARVIQGAAAAMMSPVGRLVVLRSAEKKDLMRALSTLVWPALFAPVVGPPLGGLITEVASWRWAFYINLPIGLLGIALVLAFIPNGRPAEQAPFDTRGFLLMATALGCLTYGLDLLGVGRGAAPGLVWLGAGLLAASAVIGLLAVRHARRAPHPVVDLTALRIRSFFVAVVSGGTLSRAAIGATPFLLPLMFQVGFGLSPSVSGLLLLIYMLGNLLMKTVTNPILTRFGIRNVLIVNGLLASLGIAGCALISPGLPLALSGALLFFAGSTRSMQFTAITMVNFADVSAQQRAPASVLASLAQQIGFSLGVALGALMLNFSQALRGASALGVFDFRVALVLAGALSALAVFSYATLPPDAGADISGHRPRAKAQPA